jgi:predicted nucleotidyltransferase
VVETQGSQQRDQQVDEQRDRAGASGPTPLEEAFGAYLTEAAERADRLRAEASRSLVAAARQAAGLGWSQRRIAAALGRSQPEVARLLRRVDLVHTPPGAVLVGETAHGAPEHSAAGPTEGPADRRSVVALDEPASVLGRVLSTRRDAVVEAAARHGLSNVRVFGSVARGEDGPDSDVDLLVDLAPEVSLIDLGRAEVELTRILERPVDVVPERMLKPRVVATVEAIAL